MNYGFQETIDGEYAKEGIRLSGEKNNNVNTRLWERKGADTAEVTSVSGYFFRGGYERY